MGGLKGQVVLFDMFCCKLCVQLLARGGCTRTQGWLGKAGWVSRHGRPVVFCTEERSK